MISLGAWFVHAAECGSHKVTTGVIAPNCQQNSLHGEWWAIPGQLIPPALIHQYQDDAIALDVPGYWPEEKININTHYPSGVITLWTTVKLTGGMAKGEGLAIWPGRQRSAIRIYVDNGNGTLLKVYDNLSAFIDESDLPNATLPLKGSAGLLNSSASFQLPKLYSGSQVIIQLYVDDFRTGSISQPPQLGLKDQLHREIMHRWLWHVLVMGASLLVAIYAASQAYFSVKRRPVHIFLMLMALGAGVRLLVTSSMLGYLFPSLTINDYIYMGWISFLGLLAIFFSAQVFMHPLIFKRYVSLKKVLFIFSAVPFLLLLLIPILDLNQFLLVGHLVRACYVILALSYILFLMWQVWLRPKEQWLPFLVTTAIIACGSYDAYLYVQNKDPYIESFSVAIFIFITVQALYYGWEHMRLLSREQRLALNLEELSQSVEGQVRNRTHELQTANARLSLAATTDPLTGLPNRRAFDTEIENEIRRSKRNNLTLCLAIADLDWFKSVNDRFGHDFGDRTLQVVGEHLQKRLRTTDFVARIGGEEFAIILPSTDIDAANMLLAKLCEGISQIMINDTVDYQPSMSIGCTQWQDVLSIDELYKLADQALYQAKNNGRGRVELSSVS